MISFLASHMFQQQSNWSRSSDSETPQNKKDYLKVLKFKPMLIKVKASEAFDVEMHERLINVSMIKEVKSGWKTMEVMGLLQSDWSTIEFIDGSSVYAAISIDELLSEIEDIQDRVINVKTYQRRGFGGPL